MMIDFPGCAIEADKFPSAPVGVLPKSIDARYCWSLQWPYGHSETEVTIPARTVEQMTASRSVVSYEPFNPEKPRNPAPQEIQKALVELVYAGKLTDDECDFVCDYWNYWPEQDWHCRWLRHLKEYWH